MFKIYNFYAKYIKLVVSRKQSRNNVWQSTLYMCCFPYLKPTCTSALVLLLGVSNQSHGQGFRVWNIWIMLGILSETNVVWHLCFPCSGCGTRSHPTWVGFVVFCICVRRGDAQSVRGGAFGLAVRIVCL
jgi:hypothetical protein